MPPDQRPYAEAVTRWLRRQGYRDLVRETAPVAERVAAARSCDICLLLLGPTYARRDPQSSFSITELEAYAALEGNASKLLIFAQPAAEMATSVEQREFVARLRNFTGGTFQATCATPAEFVAQVRAALERHLAAEAEAASLDVARAVMISSTGDLAEERAREAVAAYEAQHPRNSIADSVYRLDARLEEARAGLRSSEQEARRAAVLAIAKFGPHAAPAVSELTAALSDPDDFVREKACLALLAIGAASAPALPELLRVALHDADNWVRGAANEAIACLRDSAANLLPSVEAELHVEDPSLRAHAIMTVGAFGEHASFLAPALINIVFHDPSDVAIRAVIALTQMGAEAIAALNTAAEAALRSGDRAVKEIVLPNLLIALGPRAAPLVEAVRDCISDPDLPQHIRGRITTSIGYLKTAAEPLIPELRLLLGDRNTSWAALQALGEVGPVALPLLDDVLALHDDRDESIRAAVYSALRAMQAPNTPEVMAAWIRGMDDNVKMVRSSACDLARVLRPMTSTIAGELVRRYHTTTDSDDLRDLTFVLNERLPECWDVGPLSPDAEATVLLRDH
jgi:hypothetical protein